MLVIKGFEKILETSGEAPLSEKEVENVCGQHSDFEGIGQSLAVEVDLIRDEGPEDGEVFVSCHVVPECCTRGNAVSSSPGKLGPLDVVMNRTIAKDKW